MEAQLYFFIGTESQIGDLKLEASSTEEIDKLLESAASKELLTERQAELKVLTERLAQLKNFKNMSAEEFSGALKRLSSDAEPSSKEKIAKPSKTKVARRNATKRRP